MKEKQIILNNLLVNYCFSETAQPATGPALIFLHGWRADSQIWRPIWERLPGERNVYCLDFPGFGKSEIPRTPLTLEDYAQIVDVFIARLNLTRVCLVGHSFGGRVAIKLAAGNPSILERLILVDSAGERRFSVRQAIVTSLAKLLKPAFAIPVLQRFRQGIYRTLGAEDYLARPELKSTFLNIIKENLSPLLAQIKCPVLLIWGETDLETPLAMGQRMNAAISDSRLVIFRRAGHFCFLEFPDKFVKELTRFLNESI